MMIKINLDKNHNRLLLLSAVELFLQSYGSNQLGNDYFAFHSPLTGMITKIHHVNHRYDKQTKKLLADYKAIRQMLLDDTIAEIDEPSAEELSTVIENYIQEFAGPLTQNQIRQLKNLDYQISKPWR